MFSEKISVIVLATFFFITMAFAAAFYEIKLIFYIGLILYVVIQILMGNRSVPRQVLYLLPWYSYFTFSLLLGVSFGYSIDFELISNYFFIPISAALMAALVDSEKKVKFLKNALIVIALLICLLNLFFIINGVFKFDLTFFDNPAFGSVVISDETIEFRSTSHPALMFLLPYMLVLYFYSEGNTFFEDRLILITLLISVFVILLSGRRALQLVFILSLSIIYLFRLFSLSGKRRSLRFVRTKLFSIALFLIMVSFLPIALSYFLGMDDVISSILETFTSAFKTDNASGAVRLEQSIALLNGFYDSPLVGNGLNSFAKSCIRSKENPWSYEMTYLALLFQTGLSGFIVFFIYCYKVASANFRSYSKSIGSHKNFFLGVFAGVVAYIFVGSSNPMVYYIWFWSISLIAFNPSLSNNKSQSV
jgi:hypothetical protein